MCKACCYFLRWSVNQILYFVEMYVRLNVFFCDGVLNKFFTLLHVATASAQTVERIQVLTDPG